MITKENIPQEVLLAINRALLGEVNPSLIAMAFEWNKEEDEIVIYVYQHDEFTEALEEHYDVIASEASADFFFFGRLFQYDLRFIRLDKSDNLPSHSFWVFRRRDPFVDPS